jgi:protein TonB
MPKQSLLKQLFDPRTTRPYLAGSVAAHVLLGATALLFRSDLDAHAPRVLYAELLEAQAPAQSAPAGAPKALKKVAALAAPAPAEASPDPARLSSTIPEAAPAVADAGTGGKAGEGPEELSATRGSELNLYVSRVIDLLNRARTYPRDALAREEEGVVVLEVNVAGDGSLSEEKVEVPSPYPSLNRAALETLKRVGHFPAPPRPQLTIHVPIRFKIQGR